MLGQKTRRDCISYPAQARLNKLAAIAVAVMRSVDVLAIRDACVRLCDAYAGLEFGRASEKGNQGNLINETSRKAAPLLHIRQMQKGNFEVMYK